MQLQKAIESRKSVRKYKPKKPDWRDIIECIDAARYAPMAGNIYTPQFILVTKKEKIQKLAEAAQQQFVGQAHYVVVVCSNKSRTINAYEERGINYCKYQAGAAIQNILLKIEEKGLSTCWVGHFVEYIVKESLGIPENVDVIAMLPIGYENQLKAKPKKTRIDLNHILFFDKYKNKRMQDVKAIDT